MNLVIRQAVPEDAEALLENVQRLCAEPVRNIALGPGEFAMTLEEERKFLAERAASPNSAFFVAEANGRIVGSLSFSMITSWLCYCETWASTLRSKVRHRASKRKPGE